MNLSNILILQIKLQIYFTKIIRKNMNKSQKDKSVKTQKHNKSSHTKISMSNRYRGEDTQQQAPIANAINQFISHTLRPILINQIQQHKSKKQLSKTRRSPSATIFGCKTTKNQNSKKDCKTSDEKLNKYFQKKVKNVVKEKVRAKSSKKLKKVSTSDEILNIQDFSPDQATIQYHKPENSSDFLTSIVNVKDLQNQQQKLRIQLKEEMDKSKQVLIKMQNEKMKIVMQHQKSLSVMSQKLQNMNLQVKSQQQKRNLLQRDVKEYMNEIEKVRMNLSKKQSQYDSLKIEYNKVRVECLQKNKKIGQYKENIEALEQKVQTVECQNKTLQEKVDKEKKQKVQIKIQAQQILYLLRQQFPEILKKSNPNPSFKLL